MTKQTTFTQYAHGVMVCSNGERTHVGTINAARDLEPADPNAGSGEDGQQLGEGADAGADAGEGSASIGDGQEGHEEGREEGHEEGHEEGREDESAAQ